jgi:hypothetical protein
VRFIVILSFVMHLGCSSPSTGAPCVGSANCPVGEFCANTVGRCTCQSISSGLAACEQPGEGGGAAGGSPAGGGGSPTGGGSAGGSSGGGAAGGTIVDAGVFSESRYLKAPRPTTNDRFGRTVEVSGDGRTLAVGADSADLPLAAGAGVVFVFEADGGLSELKLPVPRENDNLGRAMAFSFDGQRLAVSFAADRPSTDVNDNAGAVAIFARQGSGWAQEHECRLPNARANDDFGRSVALSASGDVLLVGAPREDSVPTASTDFSLTDSGAVAVFRRMGTQWQLVQVLKSSVARSGNSFGEAVAVTADGRTLFVGEPGDPSVPGSANVVAKSGAVEVFEQDQQTNRWVLTSRLKAPTLRIGDAFGSTLATDGVHLLVSSAGFDHSAAILDSGEVNLFTRINGVWSFATNVRPRTPVENGRFGRALRLSANSRWVIVGEPGAERVSVYSLANPVLSPIAELRASNSEPDDSFGWAVAVGPEAVLVGAYGEASALPLDPTNNLASWAGAAYVFTLP